MLNCFNSCWKRPADSPRKVEVVVPIKLKDKTSEPTSAKIGGSPEPSHGPNANETPNNSHVNDPAPHQNGASSTPASPLRLPSTDTSPESSNPQTSPLKPSLVASDVQVSDQHPQSPSLPQKQVSPDLQKALGEFAAALKALESLASNLDKNTGKTRGQGGNTAIDLGLEIDPEKYLTSSTSSVQELVDALQKRKANEDESNNEWDHLKAKSAGVWFAVAPWVKKAAEAARDGTVSVSLSTQIHSHLRPRCLS
jgi:hypothetical protein